LQPNAIQKNIQVEHQGAILPPVYLEADRALLQQAISNLVDNAIKYTPVNGHVQVGIIQKPSSIMVTVRDSGIGIAPLDLPHVFEKFYRSGRREQNQQKSGGLGLAIVKSIAEHHGGTVHVDSQLGKGSVFALEIPLNGANHD
jgi:signal transduction histidine kinase